MSKVFLILLSFLFVTLGSNLCQASNGDNLTKTLTSGKWVNRADGYIPNALGKSDAAKEYSTVKRFKMYEFNTDGTFMMDSIKQRYTGKWQLAGDTVKMLFNPKVNIKLIKGSTNSTYGKMTDTIKMHSQTALLKGDVLKFSASSMDAIHHNSAIAGAMNFWEFTGFSNAAAGNLVMILVGMFFIFLAIKFNYEPMLLIPIGMGILVGNIPFFMADSFNMEVGIYEPGSVLNILYQGVVTGWYPPIVFLGIGAMTDFSSLISNPRLMILGAAAQLGVFSTFMGALWLGFSGPEAGAIGIIGGADGPTAIFLASKLANGINVLADGTVVKNLIGPIAIAAYSYMALIPLIQPPVIKLLTTKKERLIKMRPPRTVTRTEKQMFPVIGLLITAFIVPSALPLLGMLFFGNLLKESTVTDRLAKTASGPLIDSITMLLGLTVGASTQADVFLQWSSLQIFILGAVAFTFSTAGGVIFGKILNWCSPKDNPVNPMIGASGVSAVPGSARVVQNLGLKEDPTNHLLFHAMAPNVAGVIGSAVAAGLLLSFLM